jgi:uncharacterized protein (UPF0332 family)
VTIDDQRRSLVLYRIQSAKEKLNAAEALLEKGHYKDSVGRSYYAIFTASRALLATRQLDSSKHSGVIALFNKYFVKCGIVSKETSKWLERAKLYREQADYGDFYLVSVQEAAAQIQSARDFIEEIEKAIDQLAAADPS